MRTIGGLVASIAASSVAANIVTAGRMFRSEVERRGTRRSWLARAIGDTAVPTSTLVPWNSCGAYIRS